MGNTVLTKKQEEQFLLWYMQIAEELNLNTNPDDVRHFYDYRGFFNAMQEGTAEIDKTTNHFPSKWKKEGHPRLFINGVDTRTERVE